jgi:hypothetical protein
MDNLPKYEENHVEKNIDFSTTLKSVIKKNTGNAHLRINNSNNQESSEFAKRVDYLVDYIYNRVKFEISNFDGNKNVRIQESRMILVKLLDKNEVTMLNSIFIRSNCSNKLKEIFLNEGVSFSFSFDSGKDFIQCILVPK